MSVSGVAGTKYRQCVHAAACCLPFLVVRCANYDCGLPTSLWDTFFILSVLNDPRRRGRCTKALISSLVVNNMGRPGRITHAYLLFPQLDNSTLGQSTQVKSLNKRIFWVFTWRQQSLSHSSRDTFMLLLIFTFLLILYPGYGRLYQLIFSSTVRQ